MEYVLFQTPAGWMALTVSPKGPKSLVFPQPKREGVKVQLGNATPLKQPSKAIDNLVARLQAYFSGENVRFDDELDLDGATEFQGRVWAQARKIPWGQTVSYGALAKQIGCGSPRAVGQALARNPLPIIIPCHRVLASGGSLGGFSGGLEMKRRLLKLEGSLP